MNDIPQIQSTLKTEHFVGGKRVAALSKDTYTSRNPATGEVVATFVLGNSADMDRAILAARHAFDTGPWPRMSITARAKILQKFSQLIARDAERLGTIESLDVGKLRSECVTHDVARASSNIAFFAHAVEQISDEAFIGEGNFLGKPIKTLSVVERTPIGVAGLIVPWNSPLMLGTWKIGPCLATGNCCVVKPAPWAALSILQLGELANEAGIPEGVLNIVPGGAEAGDTLVRHILVNRISFTGSVPVGRAINRANAEVRMEPISLELGGKSPAVVFADCDLDATVKGVARGIFRSQGQSCVAGSRLILEQSIYQEFMQRLIAAVRAMKIGDQLSATTEIGPLITEEHRTRVEQHIARGVEQGARLTVGGKRPTDTTLTTGYFLEPTIFEGVTREMSIWKEEIFGPLLCVIPFKTEKEAIDLANDSEFGLSATVWTSNLNTALSMSRSIQSGMVWINSHFVRDLRAPFGGIKNSGIGSEGGRYSLEFFTKPKMICLPQS